MRIATLGIDLGKNVCSLAGLDEAGTIILRRRIQRHRLFDFLGRLDTCTVAMEACCGAHQALTSALANSGPAYSPRDGSPARGRAEGTRRKLTFGIVLQLSGVLLSRRAASQIGSS